MNRIISITIENNLHGVKRRGHKFSVSLEDFKNISPHNFDKALNELENHINNLFNMFLLEELLDDYVETSEGSKT